VFRSVLSVSSAYLPCSPIFFSLSYCRFTAFRRRPRYVFGTFFAPDAGGYAIAAELSADPQLALFSGLVVAPVMGSVISFGIPVAFGLIPRGDIRYFAFGVLSALIADPFGCFFGGLLTPIRLFSFSKPRARPPRRAAHCRRLYFSLTP
jgi:ethanolamine transporter EutH